MPTPDIIATLLRMETDEAGLTPRQIECLLNLHERQRPVVQIDLAADLSIRPAVMVSIIDALRKRRFIHSVRAEDDRRLVLISITDKGRDFVSRLRLLTEDLNTRAARE